MFMPFLAEISGASMAGMPMMSSISGLGALGFAAGEVYLDDGQDLKVVVREVGVRQGLAPRRPRRRPRRAAPLAGRERAGDPS